MPISGQQLRNAIKVRQEHSECEKSRKFTKVRGQIRRLNVFPSVNATSSALLAGTEKVRVAKLTRGMPRRVLCSLPMFKKVKTEN